MKILNRLIWILMLGGLFLAVTFGGYRNSGPIIKGHPRLEILGLILAVLGMILNWFLNRKHKK